MLSSNEHPGLFVFLLGLIVVVFVGIGLSMAVDRRFSFSSSVSRLETEVRNNESELERLREIHRLQSWNLTELEPKRKTVNTTLTLFQKHAADLPRRRTTLLAERENLMKSIPALEEEFSSYRAKYRGMVRDAAIGESLGSLSILGGREYHKVFILQVTDAGMEIRHEHGSARLKASELDAAFWNRFQWEHEESRARKDEKNPVPDAVAAKSNAVHPETVLPQPSKAGPDAAKIAAHRAKVSAWKAKVTHLRAERQYAMEASSGPQVSPPGSLETWQARAMRLGVELAKAEAELVAARAALAVASPGDELLRSHNGGR